MTEPDEADRFFRRGGDIWVHMQSGREIRLGPVDQVSNSMRQFLAERIEFQPPPRNQVS